MPQQDLRSLPLTTVDEVLDDLRAGRMALLVSDGPSALRGDLLVAAAHADAAAVNVLATDARGLVSLALTPERCLELGLRPMTPRNVDGEATPFTLSVEARTGVTTGISAADRARTIAVAIDPGARSRDLVTPGHMFPLQARPGGTLERPGRAEAAVDLARLAGLVPAGVLCEVLDEDGELAGPQALAALCDRLGVRAVHVRDVAQHRRRGETRVERVMGTSLLRDLGPVRIAGYRTVDSGHEHVVLLHGEVTGAIEVPVHVHRAAIVEDLFAVRGGRSEIDEAIAWMREAGCGVLVYLAAEDPVQALVRRLDDGAEGRDAVPAHDDFAVTARILADLGVRSVRLRGADRLAVEELALQGVEAHLIHT